MAKVISIEERRAANATQQLTLAGKLGRLAGEITVTLDGINPADFERIRKELLQTARKLSRQSKTKGVQIK